jgi:hypothetical protein
MRSHHQPIDNHGLIGSIGEALTKYPQAFTHLALISAAFSLDRVLGAQ